MKYFDGLDFPLYNSHPIHQAETRNTPVYYGIQFNYSGRFWLRIDGGVLHEHEGPCAFITHPGAYFEYGSYPGTPRSHHFICCHGPRIQDYIAGGLLDCDAENAVRSVKNPEWFLECMQSIMTQLKSSLPIVPPRVVHRFEELLLTLQESSAEDTQLNHWHADAFKALISRLRMEPMLAWDFHEEARRRGMTTTHFRRVFKTFAGSPPQQFLIQCRLQRAASLLLTTTLPCSKIAETVGIPDEFYFSKLFKARYKSSPVKYRRHVIS